MGYLVTNSANYHWVRKVVAECNGSNGGTVLKLTLLGDPDASRNSHNHAEVNIFTEDAAMVARLVEAINGAEAALVEPDQTVAA
jgi:hypothetical protein